MRKYLLVVVLVVAALFVFNACVAETQKPEEETPSTGSATAIYNAIEPLFSAATDSTVSAVVKGIVVNAYVYTYTTKEGEEVTQKIIQIEELDGKAGLKVELSGGETLPEVGKVVAAYGTLRKYEDTYNNVVTFKLQDATYEVLDEVATPIFNKITKEFFATDNNYKLNTLVEATGLVTKVDTKYHKMYLDIDVEGSTKTIVVHSFNEDVKNWIDDFGETYIGSELYVRGYWRIAYSEWRITPRTTADIPAIGE